jgi:hypothetical protein
MSSQANMDFEEQVKLAAEAFLYGYPLVHNLHEIARFTTGPNVVSSAAIPYNTFGDARQLPDPNAKFVTPNNDQFSISPLSIFRGGEVPAGAVGHWSKEETRRRNA